MMLYNKRQSLKRAMRNLKNKLIRWLGVESHPHIDYISNINKELTADVIRTSIDQYVLYKMADGFNSEQDLMNMRIAREEILHYADWLEASKQ